MTALLAGYGFLVARIVKRELPHVYGAEPTWGPNTVAKLSGKQPLDVYDVHDAVVHRTGPEYRWIPTRNRAGAFAPT